MPKNRRVKRSRARNGSFTLRLSCIAAVSMPIGTTTSEAALGSIAARRRGLNVAKKYVVVFSVATKRFCEHEGEEPCPSLLVIRGGLRNLGGALRIVVVLFSLLAASAVVRSEDGLVLSRGASTFR